MKKSLSIFSANLLFLITMLLVLVLGSIMQLLSFTWGLIGTEVLLILLPAVLFLRARRVPLREGLRLRPVGIGTALLSVLLGISVWAFTGYIEAFMMQVSGLPPVSLPEEAVPQGAFESALYFIALAIFAPICEEALFRGAIQGAYEAERSPRLAIAITALMFAFYHFRLSGLPALLPTAFILCYVVWRSQSLLTGVLVHFGVNATSSAYSLISLNVPEIHIPLTSPLLAGGGLALTVALLVAFHRSQPIRPPESRSTEPQTAGRRAALGLYWPLGAAGLLYLLVAGLSLVSVLYPELTAIEGMSFSTPDWTEPIESRYQISNRAGEVVGQAECRLEPGQERIQLECRREVKAYQAQVGSSFFSEEDSQVEWTASWKAETLELIDYSYRMEFEDGGYQASLQDGELVVTQASGVERAALPEGALLEFEWPWRSMNLSAQSGVAYIVPFGHLLRWDPEAEESLPGVQTSLLRVYPLERLSVPAGSYETWKVSISDEETAWYASQEPGRVIQYDDGMVVYSLVK